MAFNEKIINQVKELSDFKCCRCKHISFEVHHIVPQKNGGPDTIENAAPLCPNCHSDFGDNPQKRKEITQMRDLWYRRVENQYKQQPAISNSILKQINSKLDILDHKTTNQNNVLVDLKETLKKLAIETIDQMTPGTASSTASGIANASYVSNFPEPTPEEIDAAGDEWIQQQIDIMRGK